MADPAYIGADGSLTDGDAWVAIDSTELGADTASITFTTGTGTQNWSQYVDLVALLDIRGGYSGGTSAYMVLNDDDSSTHYPAQWFRGDGTTATAGNYDYTTYGFLGNINGDDSTADIFTTIHVNLSQINTGKFKGYIAQTASDTAAAGKYVYVVASTYYGEFIEGDVNVPGTDGQKPITEIKFYTGSGDLLAGSRIDLFGVLPRMVNA